MKIVVPGLRLQNPLNNRCHWRVLSKRGREQKEATGYALLGADWSGTAKPTKERPWVVTITRLGPGTLDTDNLAASGKHVRDSIAKWCGVDDKHRDIVEYRYAQRREREYGVEICVEVANALEGVHSSDDAGGSGAAADDVAREAERDELMGRRHYCKHLRLDGYACMLCERDAAEEMQRALDAAAAKHDESAHRRAAPRGDVVMSSGRPSAKDVPEDEVLRVLRLNPGKWHVRWHGYGYMPSLTDASEVLASFPERVLLAKLDRMIKRGLIHGCACGCRGDFYVEE